MKFSQRALVLTICFALSLESFSVFGTDVWGVGFSVALLALAIIWTRPLVARRLQCWHIVLLSLLSISALGLLFFIDFQIQKQVFILLSGIVYYSTILGFQRIAQNENDLTARGMIASTTITTAFLFFTLAYATYINFSLPLWSLMVCFFFVTVLLAYQYFALIAPKAKTQSQLYALLLGIFASEISWTVHFWPFSYLTTGVIMLIFFYSLWDMYQSHLQHNLTKSRVLADIIFLVILSALVLTTARWTPVQ